MNKQEASTPQQITVILPDGRKVTLPTDRVTIKPTREEILLKRRQYRRDYMKKPEIQAKFKAKINTPEYKEKRKEYNNQPHVQEKKRQAAQLRRRIAKYIQLQNPDYFYEIKNKLLQPEENETRTDEEERPTTPGEPREDDDSGCESWVHPEYNKQ